MESGNITLYPMSEINGQLQYKLMYIPVYVSVEDPRMYIAGNPIEKIETLEEEKGFVESLSETCHIGAQKTTKVFQKASDAINPYIQKANEAIDPVAHKISETFSPVSQKLTETFSPVSQKLTETLNPIAQKVGETFSGFAHSARNKVGELIGNKHENSNQTETQGESLISDETILSSEENNNQTNGEVRHFNEGTLPDNVESHDK
jgi:hypothetical protein